MFQSWIWISTIAEEQIFLVLSTYIITHNFNFITCSFYWDVIVSAGKLSGMNENSTKVKVAEEKTDMKSVVTSVLKVANVLQVLVYYCLEQHNISLVKISWVF